MTPGIWQIVIIIIIVLILFGGRGKISQILGDLGEGINSFKKGMSDSDKDDNKKDTK